MKTIELFCGIGGFRIACDALGFETVWANDVNPEACAVYRKNFGEAELFEGDVNKIASNAIPRHDLLTAGFPCQPFSSAGKKKGIQDSRGTLFRTIVEILHVNMPKYFVLENVKRLLSMQNGSNFATIINELSHLGYRVEWRVVKASNLGLPQHRERVFIVGTHNEADDESPHVKLLSETDFNSLEARKRGQILEPARWARIEDHNKGFGSWGIVLKGRFVDAFADSFSDQKPCPPFVNFLETQVDDSFYFTENTLERIKESTYVDKYFNGVQILYNQGGGARMGYTVFGTSGIAPTLTATTSRHYERYKIGNEYRRLTNIEYARLQGFPDDHCSNMSIYKQYSLFGNAVPPAMAKWAIEKAIDNRIMKFPMPKEVQLSLL